jgi:hypothetical protein
VFLLIVGALMDIYSAIFVIVPLIAPMGIAYGIHPVHLGIVFLANIELGYLMPPMGENLFLSSYRFKQSLTRVYLSTGPCVLILLRDRVADYLCSRFHLVATRASGTVSKRSIGCRPTCPAETRIRRRASPPVFGMR